MCLELTGNDMKRVEIARAEIHLDKPLHMGVTLPDAISHILTERPVQAFVSTKGGQYHD